MLKFSHLAEGNAMNLDTVLFPTVCDTKVSCDRGRRAKFNLRSVFFVATEMLVFGDMAMRGLNSLIALGAWILWNPRNRIVFDGISPSVSAALCQAREEQQLWEMAGAKGLSFLAATIRLAACCRVVFVYYGVFSFPLF
jgi:hypothetical protein